MPLFICRWQNGDFSAVSAASREEAMELLDEVGNADVAELFTTKRFMVHFQLKKQVDNVEEPVPVDLEGFGDETYEMLCDRVKPQSDDHPLRLHACTPLSCVRRTAPVGSAEWQWVLVLDPSSLHCHGGRHGIRNAQSRAFRAKDRASVSEPYPCPMAFH